MDFENRIDFAIPNDILQAYGDWSAGSVDGWIVFSIPECAELAIENFLAFAFPDAKGDPFNDYAVTELLKLRGNVNITSSPFMPLARVVGSVCEREMQNPLNRESHLVLKKGYGANVFLKSNNQEIFVEQSLTALLKRSEYWFQHVQPKI